MSPPTVLLSAIWQWASIRRVRAGPRVKASARLRALCLLESDDADRVIELASRLPAIRMGGTAEVWPLTEPDHGEGMEVDRPPGR